MLGGVTEIIRPTQLGGKVCMPIKKFMVIRNLVSFFSPKKMGLHVCPGFNPYLVHRCK